jgi:DUF971 family protein
MSVIPTKLELADQDRLQVTWSDGTVRQVMVRELRGSCPCATCREKRAAPSPTQLHILADADIQPVRITAMKPVGNYAYSIGFSDGHNTGIYTLESLREMGAEVTPR